ncbi:hypothetical protein FBZ96_104415 [Bradyrhizobium stylosanthis]|uniref:DUF2946 family protein n=2 Tax=Bradyrhizobium stylosanthis TaxID=1803665 RepID=A0A560DQP4_9BRAD|nr:hypothetical protein FBZ96_104415 [Bradyrhizobium stylosanthis]
MLVRTGSGPKGKSIEMRLVRTILAFAIAISLAMLPVGASASGLAMSPDDMQTAMQMAGGADMSMDECCPDMKGTGSQPAGYKCGMGFCCVGGIVALGDVRPLAFAFPAVAAGSIAIPADQVVSVRRGSPPFRPPRV